MILYTTWFLFGRLYILIADVVQKKIHYNVKEFGLTLITLNYILMIAEIINL